MAAEKKPNFVIIVADGQSPAPCLFKLADHSPYIADLGFSDLGCFGSEINTVP